MTNVPRSLSFTNLLGQKGNYAPGSSSNNLLSGATTPVLGQNYRSRSPKFGRRSNSSTNVTTGTSSTGQRQTNTFTPSVSSSSAVRLPQTPRPARTKLIIDAIKKGIREDIDSITEEINKLQQQTTTDGRQISTSNQAKVFETEKQVRSAIRQQKGLEFHLSKIEELEENYELQQQLREGVTNMAKAYVASSNRRDSLTNVKYGYKECSQTMCAIEAQLESLLGTFKCQMKGLVGFARLVVGDVYEIVIRHGSQKWKTKGKIKSKSQVWDTDVAIFKALLGDIINIKVVEVKSLGRSVVLGQKNCETRDLFSTHPQLMTVNINTNGSLKLSLVVTWNPLDGADESIVFYEPPPKSLTRCRKSGHVLSGVGEDPKFNTISESQPASSAELKSFDPAHLIQSTPPKTYHGRTEYGRPHSMVFTNNHSTPCTPQDSSPSPLSENQQLTSSLNDISGRCNQLRAFDVHLKGDNVGVITSIHTPESSNETVTLEDAVHSLQTALEDYQGQYVELAQLNEDLRLLNSLLKKSAVKCSSRQSRNSLTIESALEAFDFLESEITECLNRSVSNEPKPDYDLFEPENRVSSSSPESVAHTADSGIGSPEAAAAATGGEEDERNLDSSWELHPEQPSTGNEQVDVSLLWHLAYCERLLKNLGHFGPLKCQEIYSLDKLVKQTRVIDRLISLAQAGPHISDLQQAIREFTSKEDCLRFWHKCIDHSVLYMNAERFLAQLERQYGDAIRNQYDVPASKVFRTLVMRVLDVPVFDPEMTCPCPIITMPQVMCYFNEHAGSQVLHHLQGLVSEVWITSRLQSNHADIVVKTILSFKESLPSKPCLIVITLLLLSENLEIRQTAVTFLEALSVQPELRKKSLAVLVELLEDTNSDTRSAACIALKLFKGEEALEQLTFLTQSDPSHVVKTNAKEALFASGDSGRVAFEESQLSFHGFQGFKMKF